MRNLKILGTPFIINRFTKITLIFLFCYFSIKHHSQYGKENEDKLPVTKEASDNTKPLEINVRDYLRDPYILDFLNLPSESILESTMEQGLIDNLQKFLLELGRGFAFVQRQQRINIENQDFAIDLVFYNFKLKCFLLIDIKLGKLTHQDVGQMDTYVRIYDHHYKSDDDNPTVGLILCSEKSDAIARYSILNESKQIFAAKYLSYLPTEDELKRELQRERAVLILRNNEIEYNDNLILKQRCDTVLGKDFDYKQYNNFKLDFLLS